jgi:serine/threonine protein kinase/curved DNA-binding protein CbpA
MADCSNKRCAQPNPGQVGRCLNCNSLLVGKLVRDRYVIKEMISRGGFGATYLINDLDCFEEPRLLKELRPASGENDDETGPRKETAERLFIREAKTLLNLNHTGIPRLYAYFVQNNFSYLLQEYIPGSTLAEAVEERGKNYNEQEARELLRELAEILRFLHSQSPPIIHRDIKPQNLMRHADGRLLLIDFGAVCRAANKSTGSQTLIGSPGYAPPEQIIGQPVPQSDLYAAGVTAVRLLTGIHPTQLTNKRNEKMEWEQHSHVSTPFRDLINELLARDPTRRLSSAEELLRWLKELSVVPPILTVGAPPPVAKPKADYTMTTTGLNLKADAPPADVNQLDIAAPDELICAPDIINALASVETIEKGSLREVPTPVILFCCYKQGVSGKLTFHQGEFSKSIHFDQGAIAFATGSSKTERLSEYLLRKGRLTPEEFESATRAVDKTGQRMGAVLLKLGIISQEELTPLIVEHISHIVYSTFDWTQGSFEFVPSAAGDEAIKMPFSTADIIFEGIRRLDNLELIKQWLGDFRRLLRTTRDPLLLYQTVTLNPREGFIVSRIDSAMSIEELLSFGGLPENETIRTVCGLLAIGMLEPADKIDEVNEEPHSTPVGNVLSQPAPLPQDFDFSTAAAFCYEVESKLHSMENSDAYGVLEIGRHASDSDIAEAYKNLARKYHPDRHSQLLNYNLSLRQDLEKIFKNVASAYDMLKTPDKRNHYNSLSRTGKFRIDEVKTIVSAQTAPQQTKSFGIVESAAVSGEEWRQRGQQFYRSGQYQNAADAFKRAIDASPNTAEYHFLFASALTHIANCFLPAETEFYRALELDPNNADYYAEFGLFYQRLNLTDRAEAMFSYCLKLAPNHAIALRSKFSH